MDFTVKLRGFGLFGTSFEKNYGKIISNLFESLQE